jgi:tetratricopeptide (TPR) repeat protein
LGSNDRAVIAVAVFANGHSVGRAEPRRHRPRRPLRARPLRRAIAHYCRALALEPIRARIQQLAATFRAKGDLPGLATYQRALKLKPDYRSPVAWRMPARCRQADDAIDHFQQALRSIGGSPTSTTISELRWPARQARQSRGRIPRRDRLDPVRQGHRNLGGALASQGSRDEAVSTFDAGAARAGAMHRRTTWGAFCWKPRPGGKRDEFRATLRHDAGRGGRTATGIALGSQGKLDEAIARFEPR